MQVRCSDNATREVDDQVVADLVALAERLTLPAAALDDLVHDCCDATASRRVNSDPDLPEDIEAAQDLAYSEASGIGSQTNNGGRTAQLAFLVAELGAAEVTRALSTLPR